MHATLAQTQADSKWAHHHGLSSTVNWLQPQWKCMWGPLEDWRRPSILWNHKEICGTLSNHPAITSDLCKNFTDKRHFLTQIVEVIWPFSNENKMFYLWHEPKIEVWTQVSINGYINIWSRAYNCQESDMKIFTLKKKNIRETMKEKKKVEDTDIHGNRGGPCDGDERRCWVDVLKNVFKSFPEFRCRGPYLYINT